MKQPKALFVISRYKEKFEWIKQYTDNYIIYNKGEPILGDPKIINKPNIGGNQRDIFEFIYDNYENLPELMIFVQAYPFDHCNEEKFKKIIFNEEFTSIESYEHLKDEGIFRKDTDGGYMEHNNSWYINSHNSTHKQTCIYSSFDEFMKKMFKDYVHIEWIRFAPGSQYLIKRTHALHYSKKFWKLMMEELPRNNMTEAHIIERACWYILKGYYNG